MINNTKLQNHGNEKRNYEPNCMKHIQRVVYSFADNIVYYIDLRTYKLSIQIFIYESQNCMRLHIF